MELTEEDGGEVAAFACSFAKSHHEKIDVALGRLHRAMTTRFDAADALIDAVIAWENLFGSQQGEQRLRISSALAWLLKPDDATERAAVQMEAKKLYDARSDVVHANVKNLKKHDLPELSRRAIDLGVDALRALYNKRPELVADDDRAMKLVLGQ